MQLTGFVRVKSRDAWNRQIGVITSTPFDEQRGWYWVRFGNSKPLAFGKDELEPVEQEHTHESTKS